MPQTRLNSIHSRMVTSQMATATPALRRTTRITKPSAKAATTQTRSRARKAETATRNRTSSPPQTQPTIEANATTSNNSSVLSSPMSEPVEEVVVARNNSEPLISTSLPMIDHDSTSFMSSALTTRHSSVVDGCASGSQSTHASTPLTNWSEPIMQRPLQYATSLQPYGGLPILQQRYLMTRRPQFSARDLHLRKRFASAINDPIAIASQRILAHHRALQRGDDELIGLGLYDNQEQSQSRPVLLFEGSSPSSSCRSPSGCDEEWQPPTPSECSQPFLGADWSMFDMDDEDDIPAVQEEPVSHAPYYPQHFFATETPEAEINWGQADNFGSLYRSEHQQHLLSPIKSTNNYGLMCDKKMSTN